MTSPVHATGPAPRLEVLRDAEAWDKHADAWDGAARAADAFYLGHAWLRAWWNAFGKGRLHLGILRQGDRVVGLAPWRRRAGLWLGLPVRLVESLFNADAVGSDVYLEEPRRRSAELLLDGLADEPWDVLRLRCTPADSLSIAALRDAAAGRGLASYGRPRQHWPYITVGEDWETFLAGRSRNFRRTLRHKRNRLAGEISEARYDCLAGPPDIEAALPEVMQVALRSWSGREGSSIASPGARRFYEPALRALARAGALRLWTLRLEGRLAAFEVHVPWQRRVAELKGAYDHEFARLSPGSLLEAHALEALFRDGSCEHVDLLGDAEDYKLNWTEQLDPRVDVFVFNRSRRARLLALAEFRWRPALGALKRRLRRRP